MRWAAMFNPLSAVRPAQLDTVESGRARLGVVAARPLVKNQILYELNAVISAEDTPDREGLKENSATWLEWEGRDRTIAGPGRLLVNTKYHQHFSAEVSAVYRAEIRGVDFSGSIS